MDHNNPNHGAKIMTAAKTCTITIGIENEESDDSDLYVHQTVNDLADHDYDYFSSEVDAHEAAVEYKRELEEAGYSVNVVWDCYRPGWATI